MRIRTTLATLLTLLPALALAHSGADGGSHHGSAFVEGLVHPFNGLDHLAAMVAVGVWSALAFRDPAKRMWAAPVAFASVLLVGGLLALGGMSPAGIEPMIAASLLVIGVLVATQMKLPLAAGATLVSAFALFHGLAHGNELPAQQAFAALTGMVLSTMTLHMAGMLLGRFVLRRHLWLPRIAGASVAVLGVGLLSSTI